MRTTFDGLDVFARLRAVADGYGVPPVAVRWWRITDVVTIGDDLVRRRVGNSDPGFVEMHEQTNDEARPQRRPRSLEGHYHQLLNAVD